MMTMREHVKTRSRAEGLADRKCARDVHKTELMKKHSWKPLAQEQGGERQNPGETRKGSKKYWKMEILGSKD